MDRNSNTTIAKLLITAALGAALATAGRAATTYTTEDSAASVAEKKTEDRGYFVLGTRPEWTHGDFGTAETTDTFDVPLSIRYVWFPFAVKLTVPYVLIDGSDDVRGDGGDNSGPGSGGGDDDTASTGTGFRQGLGDVTGSLSYTLDLGIDAIPYFTVTGKVKAPTATSSTLGIDGWDFGVEGEISDRYGPLFPYVSFGRRFYGSSGLSDRFYASVGGDLELASFLDIGLAYDWSEANSDTRSDSHELSPSITLRLGKRFSIEPYGIIGIAGDAPDYGAGLGLRLRL
jgi:hypothetical protein